MSATGILRLSDDAQMDEEEMYCASCSRWIGKFYQTGIVLTICPLNARMDNG